MAEPFAMRPVADDEFGAFLAVIESAFNSVWPSQGLLEHERITFEPDRSLAAFDGVRPVGTAAAYSFELTVPGGTAAAAGVTGVAVLPEYRRRGILSALMRRQLADVHERGETIAALFASESGIYGRFGYGCAAEQLDLRFRRGEGAQLRAEAEACISAGPIRLLPVEPAQAKAELAAVYDAVRPGRPGMWARDDRWWTVAVADPDFARDGQTALRAVVAVNDREPRGYALYRAKPDWGEDGMPAGVLTISELVCAGPDAAAALWADLLSRDLIGEVRARQRPVDDAVLYLLADRRRARAGLDDGLWIRIIDVAGALSRRRYASAVDVVIEVADELLPDNCGRWRLESGGPDDPVPARCTRTSAPADIGLTVRALGAAYLGGTRLGALAAAGHVAELRPGAVARLSAAIFWDPAPWCPINF